MSVPIKQNISFFESTEQTMQDNKDDVNTMAGLNGKEFEIVDSPVPKEFELIDKYWKASNYLAVGQVRQHQQTKIFSSSREHEDLLLSLFLL
jgi:hypothetical protein